MDQLRTVLVIAERGALQATREWRLGLAWPIAYWPLLTLLTGTVLGRHVGPVTGGDFRHFITPGFWLVAVANAAPRTASASVWEAARDGSLDVLLAAPVRRVEVGLGLLLGALSRPLIIGTGVVGCSWLIDAPVERPLMLVAAGSLAVILLTALGLLIGVACRSYDAVFLAARAPQPLVFASAAFIPGSAVPAWERALTWGDPLFYPMEAVRAGWLGSADIRSWLCLAVTVAFTTAVVGAYLWLFSTEAPRHARHSDRPRRPSRRTHRTHTHAGPVRLGHGVWVVAERQALRACRAWVPQLLFPLLNGAAYTIFWGLALSKTVGPVGGSTYASFVAAGVCGLVTSLWAAQTGALLHWQAKADGYLDELLSAPLRPVAVLSGYVLGSSVRVLLVGAGFVGTALMVMTAPVQHPLELLADVLLVVVQFTATGVIIGICARSQQHVAVLLLVLEALADVSGFDFPLAFIRLPYRELFWLNPLLYPVQAAQSAMTGTAQMPTWASLTVAAAWASVTVLAALWLLASGRGIRP